MCIWVYVRLGCLYVREYVYAYMCLWMYLLAIRKQHFVYIPVRLFMHVNVYVCLNACVGAHAYIYDHIL